MRLIDYIQPRHRDSKEIAAIQAAIQPQIDTLHNGRVEFIAQLNVATATWGLDYWEQSLGIAIDASKPLEFRRARITAKLRTQGTTTVDSVKNVCASYTEMAVEVEERPAEYTVAIYLLGALGTPTNLDDLLVALGEVLPAHLAFELIYRYQAGTLGLYSACYVHMGDLMHIEMEELP